MTPVVLLMVVLGLVIGLLLGLLGSGGSILAVPALVYGAGLPLETAVPTSLLVVGISSASALTRRLKDIQWRLAGILSLTGAIAAIGGAAINRQLDPSILLLGFSAIMAAAGLRIIRDHSVRHGPDTSQARASRTRYLPKAAATGLLVGFLTGLFGVGGGFLILPALALLLDVPMITAVPTSLVIIVLNSAAGLLARIDDLSINKGIAITVATAATSGSLVAGRLAKRVPARQLSRWFGYLLITGAAYIVVHTLWTVARPA